VNNSRTTKSESLFKTYCTNHSYIVEKIREGTEKTPDFLVKTPFGEIIAEIKEVCPNDEDKKIISGSGGTLKKVLGKRVREKIKQATRKKYSNPNIPRVIVLYDNIIVNGVRPTYPHYHFNPADMAFGMYGELKTTLLYNKQAGKIIGTRNELGKNQHLRSDRGREISAVCLLSNLLEDGHPCLYTYHSIFALAPLSRQIFSGQTDKHFKNPSDGKTFETSWVEF
jgi:hypothetical protein